MRLTDIGMIAVVNARSKGYSQAMADAGLDPAVVLLLDASSAAPGSRAVDDRAAFITFHRNRGTECIECIEGDINCQNVIAAIKARSERYFIYSGAGGVLLRNEVLSLGKKFLHIHPGRIPDFRGSTTVYYHLLQGNTCGTSAIFLEEKIDHGPLLAEQEYPFPFGKQIDLDYVWDPRIRAATLIKVLKQYVIDGEFKVLREQGEGGETYFIMHPVLRHIAKLKLDYRD